MQSVSGNAQQKDYQVAKVLKQQRLHSLPEYLTGPLEDVTPTVWTGVLLQAGHGSQLPNPGLTLLLAFSFIATPQCPLLSSHAHNSSRKLPAAWPLVPGHALL